MVRFCLKMGLMGSDTSITNGHGSTKRSHLCARQAYVHSCHPHQCVPERMTKQLKHSQ